jgi:ABC-type glycerol-3-phosphate transport system substrate-binding protein
MPWEHDHNGDKWWDWYDYQEAACAIQDLGDDIDGAMYSHGNVEQDGLAQWSVANGGQLIDVENKKGSWNTPEFIEGQKFAVDMICKDGCMLNVDDLQAVQSGLGVHPWPAGKLGICVYGALGFIRNSEEDLVKVASVRSPNTGKGAYLGSMHFHIVTKQSKYPRQAYEFMMYLASFDVQKANALSGTCDPINAKVWEDAELQALWGEPTAVEAMLDAYENFFFSPMVAGALEWFTEIKILWGEVLRCEKTVEEQVVVVDQKTTDILAAHAE